jgi:peptidoglycan/xylan/chitin deacetylase (PgdA/CDA1 family)
MDTFSHLEKGDNMKHYWIILLLLTLVTACTKDTIEQDKENEIVQNEVGQSVQENVEEQDSKGEEPTSEENIVEGELEDEIESIQETEIQPEPLYKINEANWSVESIQDGNEKVVLLTIDDAPDKFGLQMAELLKELGVKAIYFVNGHFIDSPEEQKILKDIYNLGFPIGNHTWNHKNLKELSDEQQYEEIVKLNDEIEAITGERPKFFRAPFGSNTDYARELAKQEGMVLMNWTYGYDFMKDYMTKEAITDIMINTPLLTNGANLLMHDREWTYLALGDIVKGLKQKGYEIVDPELIETTATTK